MTKYCMLKCKAKLPSLQNYRRLDFQFVAVIAAQGYMNAFIVTAKDNRPSGQGYVLFDAEEAQLEALKVRLAGVYQRGFGFNCVGV